MRQLVPGLLVLSLTTAGWAATPTGAGTTAPATVLTLVVDDDLFRHSGVVVVYPIPTPAGAEATGEPKPLRLEARFTQVQLRYPKDGSYTFRFRPAEEGPGTAAFQT